MKWVFALLCGVILLSACVQDHKLLPETCAELPSSLPPYTPSPTEHFMQIEGHDFTLDGEIYPVRGVNYYPSRAPWRRFLTESSLMEIERELNLLQMTGFNSLRLFLWNEALFQCPDSGAAPQRNAFERLDNIIHAAALRGFHLIVTLNDLPDLERAPLYSDPPHVRAQTAFIVERYRDEAAIMAWDVRNEGDIDYGVRMGIGGGFTRDEVIDWLARSTAQVRSLAPRHLITAGWLEDIEPTIPYVDFISFHHWTGAAELTARVEAARRLTDKPILLQEFGYSTFRMSEAEQARQISDIIQAADDLAGWMIWTAFDFPLYATCIPPACPSQDNAEHHFGLWRTDYSPKPAVEVIP